jgi:S-phase kinase-associated protein 1
MDVLTSDHKTIRIPKEIYEKSEILKYIFEEFGTDKPFPIPNVDSHIMNLIMYYTLNDVKINESRQVLFDMAMAADYLHMQEFLDDVCQEIADMLRGKSPKEIRSILNISDDHTLC